jgi:hypothetical protein
VRAACAASHAAPSATDECTVVGGPPRDSSVSVDRNMRTAAPANPSSRSTCAVPSDSGPIVRAISIAARRTSSLKRGSLPCASTTLNSAARGCAAARMAAVTIGKCSARGASAQRATHSPRSTARLKIASRCGRTGAIAPILRHPQR